MPTFKVLATGPKWRVECLKSRKAVVVRVGKPWVYVLGYNWTVVGRLGGSVGSAVMISWFTGSSPASGSVLTAQSPEPASDSVSLSLPLPHSHSISLSKISKH